MGAPETTRGSYRTAIRWGLLLAGLITAGMRAPELLRFWGQWHALLGADASAADAYRTYFLVELGILAFVLATAVVLFWALGPRNKSE
ncbi:MAG TPA: hypothetical protein VMV61_02575 [Patescibacteria group bacterium]|nr:hypothetical protein [Patescibacteria group bacterium]